MEKTEEIKIPEQEYDKSGKYPRDDLVGRAFGRLIVRRWEGRNKGGKNMWLCKCECGNTKIIGQGNLKDGTTKSCRCLSLDTHTKHGCCTGSKNDHPLYDKFINMKNRCYNKNNVYYKDYGGRGIKICDEWLKSPELFVEWGLETGFEKGLTIERINNNGDYSPENCCFITQSEQANNKRSNHLITYDGRTQNITQWARDVGLSYAALKHRIKVGWEIEDALLKPVRPKTKKTA